jgi:NAD-specific glutamate dehydrogenase
MKSCVENYSNLKRRRGVADKARFSEKAESLVRSGLSASLSERVAAVSDLTTAMETARVRKARDESVRDSIVRYLSIGNASGLLPAIYRIESQRVSDQWEQLAVSILRGRYLGLMRTLVQTTEMERDLKLGVDRASFRLSRGPMEGVRKVVDGIVGEGATVGALLVAEERIRAMVLK